MANSPSRRLDFSFFMVAEEVFALIEDGKVEVILLADEKRPPDDWTGIVQLGTMLKERQLPLLVYPVLQEP